jgi:hypothetical protein
MKEARLAKHLSDILGLPRESLDNWNSDGASGCLGSEVIRLLRPKFSVIRIYTFLLHSADTLIRMRMKHKVHLP